MTGYCYSQWDGDQDLPKLDRDRLLSELERSLDSTGDIAGALWRMQREGLDAGDGKRLPGNRELFQRLEEKRQALLDRFDFAVNGRAIRRQLERIADCEPLSDLPEDVLGQLDMLRQHLFLNHEAQRDIESLLEALRTNTLETIAGAGSKPSGSGAGVLVAPRARPGRVSPSLQEALEILATLQKMDRLESQLRQNQRRRSLDAVDPALVSEVLGERCAAGIELLSRLEETLVEEGLLKEGGNGFELTPRAVRRIAQKALQEIFDQATSNREGQHESRGSAVAGARLEETRKFEFGDDLNPHLLNTVANALRRRPQRPPLTLIPDDFETYRSEPQTRSATALLIDLSRSMPRHGNFQAAKRVALALAELMRTRCPSDRLHVIGFSTYARRITAANLPLLAWDNRERHTNIQHALWLARRLLSRESGATRHIIIVTDGEPTAHIEDGQVFTRFPPAAPTRRATLGEVRNCVASGIELTIFLFEGAEFSKDFLEGMARAGHARLFFCRPETLGKYVLVDYLRRRSKVIH